MLAFGFHVYLVSQLQGRTLFLPLTKPVKEPTHSDQDSHKNHAKTNNIKQMFELVMI